MTKTHRQRYLSAFLHGTHPVWNYYWLNIG